MAWSYLPHTNRDRQAMLAEIGVDSVERLFADIPADLTLKRPLEVPAALAENELASHCRALAAKNANLTDYACFLGAGAYDHFRPSVVDHVIGRSEFYTAYTQYQPEFAQGYLQALWEYQSMICLLTAMPVANASMYDGGTALAEAAIMACGASGRKSLVVANTIHPHYRDILNTYLVDRKVNIIEASYEDGRTDSGKLKQLVGADTAAVLVQTPNFFGCVENLPELAEIAHSAGALLVVAVDPISLGILEAPGNFGADIVVGEGQSLGLSPSFGGPFLGFFATTEKLMRRMPGRVVGQTTDFEGNRGFVLTLQTREQHIRREKATSNICSNEALCALTAAVYLSAAGKEGFRRVAELSLQKAHYAYKSLLGLKGCEGVFAAPFFKEFAVRCAKPADIINKKLLAKNIIGGLDLGRYYPELSDCLLFCVTENRTRAEIDRLVGEMGAIL